MRLRKGRLGNSFDRNRSVTTATSGRECSHPPIGEHELRSPEKFPHRRDTHPSHQDERSRWGGRIELVAAVGTARSQWSPNGAGSFGSVGIFTAGFAMAAHQPILHPPLLKLGHRSSLEVGSGKSWRQFPQNRSAAKAQGKRNNQFRISLASTGFAGESRVAIRI